MGPEETLVHNELSGTVHGNVVQAGSVEQLIIHTPAHNMPVPAQLPPVPRWFTNRRTELSSLDRWRDEDNRLVVVINGAGGAGKSLVATRWLHDNGDRFPGGQLYVDLGAFSPGEVLEPDRVLEWFLIALGVPPVNIPAGVAPRQALYRSITASRTVAVLLDNADSTAQVRLLLPAGNSTAMVTSRKPLAALTLDGSRLLKVGPFSAADSVTLLVNILGRARLADDASIAKKLAELCSGMPIALALIAGRLAAHPQRPVRQTLQNLLKEHRLSMLTLEDQSMRAIFDDAYMDLPAPVAQVYRLVSLHIGKEFSVEVAAAAVDRPADDVAAELRELVDRYMIVEIGDNRFRWHDLQQDHGRTKAVEVDSDEKRHAACLRMVEWYLDQAICADLVLRRTRRRVGPRFAAQFAAEHEPGFASHQDALVWLKKEQLNIVLAVRSADSHGWDDLTWQFCEALWGFFLNHRIYSDWLDIHALGIPAAQREGHALAEAVLRIQLSFALKGLRRYNDAIREGTLALDLVTQENDEPAKAMVLSELAAAVQGAGDLPRALSYLKQAKKIREVHGTQRAVALIQTRIGDVLGELGRTDEAIVALRAAAAALSSLDRQQHGNCLTRLGALLVSKVDVSEALPLLTEALTIAREYNSPHYLAAVLRVLGDVAWQQKNFDEAAGHWTQALEIYSASGDPQAEDVQDRIGKLPSPHEQA